MSANLAIWKDFRPQGHIQSRSTDQFPVTIVRYCGSNDGKSTKAGYCEKGSRKLLAEEVDLPH
jgi:hypothetical protein